MVFNDEIVNEENNYNFVVSFYVELKDICEVINIDEFNVEICKIVVNIDCLCVEIDKIVVEIER